MNNTADVISDSFPVPVQEQSNSVNNTFFKANDLIEANYSIAYNRIPELLFPVNLIYIGGKVNDVKTVIFVDTGATSSIMTYNVAEKLGLTDFIDKRYKRVAYGIGTANIVGKIHYFELQVDDFVIQMSVDVLDKIAGDYNDFDILLGLNVLYANGINIDIRNKCLIMNGEKIGFIK